MVIKVLRENLIAKLSNIKDDNISIADIVINRQRLLQVLKLQSDDMLTISYGKVSWYDEGFSNPANHQYQSPCRVENEPCVQFSCNHTTMRLLSKPKVKWGNEPTITPLNFVDHLGTELLGIPLDTQELIRALTFVLPCVATETSRPVLNCVLFDSGKGIIKLVAADGFRLAVAKIVAKGMPSDKVLIQLADIARLMTFLKAIKPIGKGKGKVYPEVYMSHDYKTIKFSTKSDSIELDKQVGTYPNYALLIPKDGTKIQFISNDVLEATRALSHIANDGSGIIHLVFSVGQPMGKITLTAKSIEFAESSVECDAIVKADCKIAVNGKYLIDLLSRCKDTKVIVRVKHYTNPMVFDIDGKVAVIMPMYVQWE